MKNLFKLLIVLLTAPLFAFNAFAACQQVTFAYLSDGWSASTANNVTTLTAPYANTKKVIRYFDADAADGKYWFDNKTCSGTGSDTFSFYLNGTFTQGIPIGYVPTAAGQQYTVTKSRTVFSDGAAIATANMLSETSPLFNAVVVCQFVSDFLSVCKINPNITTEEFVSAVSGYNYHMTGIYLADTVDSSGLALKQVNTPDNYTNFRPIYTRDSISGNVTVTGSNTGVQTVYYSSSTGYLYSGNNLKNRVLSVDMTGTMPVLELFAAATAPSPISINLQTNTVFSSTGQTTVPKTTSYPYAFCSYNQNEDFNTTTSQATSHCRFYNAKQLSTGMPFYPNKMLTPATSPLRGSNLVVDAVSNSGAIIIKAIFPCYKADVYNLRGSSAAGYSQALTPSATIYNNGISWFSDSACTTQLTDRTFDYTITQNLAIPYAFSTGTVVPKSTTIDQGTARNVDTPIWCNYSGGASAKCTIKAMGLTGNTSYKVTNYILVSNGSAANITAWTTSTLNDAGTVDVEFGTMSLCVDINIDLEQYTEQFSWLNGKWYDGAGCTGDVISKPTFLYAPFILNKIPLTFTNTGEAQTEHSLPASVDFSGHIKCVYGIPTIESGMLYCQFLLDAPNANPGVSRNYTIKDYVASTGRLGVTNDGTTVYANNFYMVLFDHPSFIDNIVYYSDGTYIYDRSLTRQDANMMKLTLRDGVTQIPAQFQLKGPSAADTIEQSWRIQDSLLACTYDSVTDETLLTCRFKGDLPTSNTQLYAAHHALLDDRTLEMFIANDLTTIVSYCNSLTLGNNIYYSMYDGALNLRWYSDRYCQKQLGGDYPLLYPVTDGTAPLVFATQVQSASYVISDRTLTNTGPIYCEYDSSSSASGAKCKYNIDGDVLGPDGGVIVYMASPETYAVKYVANPMDGKYFKITNDIAAQTTTLTYWSAVCNALNIYFMTGNGPSSYETKTIYRTTGSWCNDSACADCGYTDGQILEYNDGYPAYFANAYVTDAYKNISSTDNYTISDNSQAFPCSYSDETSLSCPALSSSAETNANGRWFVPVYVKKLVGGAIGGGQLKSFNTVSTGTTKKVNVTYYPAQCSDYVNVHFYGFNGLGEYGEIRQSSNGSTAKYYFEGTTPYWVSHDGRTAGSFADLGIGSVINKSITVGEEPGVTFANGVSGYRATYVGGAGDNPDVIPANTVITKTTGIVDPSDTAHAYDIMVAGDSLPTIPKSQFTDGTGFTKNVYYRLLYAANCLDPDGSESGSTCELEIRPNGRALYKNQCLPGWGDGNFGDDTLANVTMSQQSISVSNKCEM